MQNTEITNFKIDKTYLMTFIGDSDLKVKWKCTKLTPKTATFQREGAEEKMTRKIKVHNKVEYVIEGNYSFAPSIRADKF
mgnify:CR=1 FL=1|tara:strand:- start:72 stop:311 length:240 start_codon:yes stop_codon:yes gene_type:complete